jgi:P4 family phage/plasmid primase-like protien
VSAAQSFGHWGSEVTEAHQAFLEARGIPLEVAQDAGLRSVDDIEAREILGRRPGSGDYSGMLIPNTDPNTGAVRENSVRLNKPLMEHDSKTNTLKQKAKFLGPQGRPNLLHFPRGTTVSELQNTKLPIVAVEGPLKALAVDHVARHQADEPRYKAIGFAGVWGHKGTIGKTTGPDGERRDVKGLIPDVHRINWKGRLTYLAFDADLDDKEQARWGRDSLKSDLTKLGAIVVIVRWAEKLGKGPDDFIAQNGPEAFLQLLEDAKQQAEKDRDALPDPYATRLTEMGNAERFIRDNAGEIRYDHEAKQWLWWDGIRWVTDSSGEMASRMKKTVRNIMLEAAGHSRNASEWRRDSAVEDLTANQKQKLHDKATKAEERAQAISKWAIQSEAAARVDAALKLARSEAGISVERKDFDTDPWLLNLLNGVLDLKTGELLPHSPERLIKKIAPVAYDPAAGRPMFDEFLATIFPGKYADVIPFLRRMIGYSLTGRTSEECLAVLYGSGRNGKGTLIKTIMALLGDYAHTAEFTTFVKRSSDAIREDIAAMAGRRFVSSQESQEGTSFAENVIKSLTGGDIVRARFLHQGSFEFKPEFKLFLATNHKPVIRGTDTGIWSRIQLIPFTVDFHGRENTSLKDDLLNELPGILNWAIEGCLEWQRDGLGLPQSVKDANQEYRSESDQVGRFIEDQVEAGEYFSVGATELYLAYKKWVTDAGEEFLTGTGFGRRLAERDFEKARNNTGFRYQKVRLRVREDDPA